VPVTCAGGASACWVRWRCQCLFIEEHEVREVVNLPPLPLRLSAVRAYAQLRATAGRQGSNRTKSRQSEIRIRMQHSRRDMRQRTTLRDAEAAMPMLRVTAKARADRSCVSALLRSAQKQSIGAAAFVRVGCVRASTAASPSGEALLHTAPRELVRPAVVPQDAAGRLRASPLVHAVLHAARCRASPPCSAQQWPHSERGGATKAKSKSFPLAATAALLCERCAAVSEQQAPVRAFTGRGGR
jgi:hypothetical protein